MSDVFLKNFELEYDEHVSLVKVQWHNPGYHSKIPSGIIAHHIKFSLDYALYLYSTCEENNVSRANNIIAKIVSLQDVDPTSKTYGIWSWLYEEPLEKMSPPDWNWADFCGIRLAQILKQYSHNCPVELVEKMKAAICHASYAIFRRNVGPEYTNIAIMGAAVTLVSGQLLNDEMLLDYGLRRLENLVDRATETGGFTEYNSPCYTVVALDECERILQLVDYQPVREVAQKLFQMIWTWIAQHYHPGTNQWAGPFARTYHDRLESNFMHRLSKAVGFELPAHPDVKVFDKDVLQCDTVEHLPCPEELKHYFSSVLDGERYFTQRSEIIIDDGSDISRVATTWMDSQACIGSVNRDNFWTQRRPLIAYWKTEQEPAVVFKARFLHDGNDFVSMMFSNVQYKNKILSGIYPLSDKGDFHDLDRPVDGVFIANDFRLRLQLEGVGVSVKQISDDVFSLSAGDRQVLVYGIESYFAGRKIHWELGSDKGIVYVDAVCYDGEAASFDFKILEQTYIFCGTMLTHIGNEDIGKAYLSKENDKAKVAWSIGDCDALGLSIPTSSQKYI